MTDNTEPTIDELVEMCFDDLCINNTGNYIRITFGDKSMNVDYEHFLAFRKRIEALISDQVAKAREEERNNVWKSFHKAYDNGDKAGDYIIKGVMKKVHANNRKFRVECYWCGGVMYRYSNKFKVKHIMCSCWRDEEKRADRIATPKRSKQ